MPTNWAPFGTFVRATFKAHGSVLQVVQLGVKDNRPKDLSPEENILIDGWFEHHYPWAVRCVTHGNWVPVSMRREAVALATDAQGFCPPCAHKKQARRTTRELAKRIKAAKAEAESGGTESAGVEHEEGLLRLMEQVLSRLSVLELAYECCGTFCPSCSERLANR